MKGLASTELSFYPTIDEPANAQQEPPRTLNDKIIYECYKPRTLNDARDFASFILKRRHILPNELDDFDQENLSSPNRDDGEEERDFDVERQLGQIPNPRLKAYFEEYAARARGNCGHNAVDRPQKKPLLNLRLELRQRQPREGGGQVGE